MLSDQNTYSSQVTINSVDPARRPWLEGGNAEASSARYGPCHSARGTPSSPGLHGTTRDHHAVSTCHSESPIQFIYFFIRLARIESSRRFESAFCL